MSKPLVVDSITYNYPEPGEDPGWGEGATGWAEGVTEVLNNLLGPGDILQTTFSIENNVVSPQNIIGLSFDISTVRSTVIQYNIFRTTDVVTYGKTESGIILAIYDPSAPASQKWSLSQEAVGDSEVTLSITDLGQFQYTSSNLSGVNYSGTMKFVAKALGL